MPLITKYLFLTVLLSPIIILVGNFKSKMLIISYAILNAVLATGLISYEIFGYGVMEPTLEQKLHHFFNNDASMIFYFIYIPLIIIGSILPMIVFFVKCVKQKRSCKV